MGQPGGEKSWSGGGESEVVSGEEKSKVVTNGLVRKKL